MLRRFLPYAVSVLFLVVIVLAWQWGATAAAQFFLPTPVMVWESIQANWLSGPATTLFVTDTALAAVGQTFTSALSGWALGAVIGIVLGVVLGRWRALHDLANVPLLLLRSVPAVAVIPICIVLFGLGFEMKLVVVAFVSIWPTLLNTASGVSQVDREFIDVAKLYRLGPVARFFRVLVPAASPKIFAGLRVSLSLSIVIAVGAEMLAGSGGLGGLAIQAQSTFDVSGLWATLLVLALFGLAVNYAFLLLERLALQWHTKRSQM